MELVFHQAARGSVPRSVADPATTLAINALGTANVFAAARDAKARRVVYASSSSVYGSSEKLPKREGEEGEPLSPYALSKRVNEETAGVFARCYGMELVGLRYFNVYGPRQDPNGPYAAVIPRFFDAILNGRSPIIYGDGRQSRDFTFVGDAVEANLLAARAPREACGGAYNIAGGAHLAIANLARKIGEIVGMPVELVFESPRAGDVMHSSADLSRARSHLSFAPRTGLPGGLEASHEFYRATYTRNA
jgi:nucleoside-diphosphate-sugar epimerase